VNRENRPYQATPLEKEENIMEKISVSVKEHYDLLIQEGNDPLNDPPVLQNYMNKWDGQLFIDALALNQDRNVLEIGVGTGRLAKKVLEIGCAYFTGIDLSLASIDRAKENLSVHSNIY